MKLTQHEFGLLVHGVRMADKTKSAMRAILCNGYSWEDACMINDTVPSTVYRAISRCKRAGPVDVEDPPSASPRRFPNVIGAEHYRACMSANEVGALVTFNSRTNRWKILRRINLKGRKP